MARFLSRGIEFDSGNLFYVSSDDSMKLIRAGTGVTLEFVHQIPGAAFPRIIYNAASDGRPQLDFSQGGTQRAFFGLASGNDVGISGSTNGDFILRAQTQAILFSGNAGGAAGLKISATNVISMSSLAGVGSRAVVADANGVLSAP